jgi:hypothetical protein
MPGRVTLRQTLRAHGYRLTDQRLLPAPSLDTFIARFPLLHAVSLPSSGGTMPGSVADEGIAFLNWPHPSGHSQPLTEKSTGSREINVSGEQSVRLTALPPSVSRLSPQRVTTLWTSTACYGDSFIFGFIVLSCYLFLSWLLLPSNSLFCLFAYSLLRLSKYYEIGSASKTHAI